MDGVPVNDCCFFLPDRPAARVFSITANEANLQLMNPTLPLGVGSIDDRKAKEDRMRKFSLITIGILLIAFSSAAWFGSRSSTELLESMRRIHPGDSRKKVENMLGPPDYILEAPAYPEWIERSAIGDVKNGTVLIYMIKRIAPKLLIIHILPDLGVQFVTWEPT
jgi:hypothetical protein